MRLLTFLLTILLTASNAFANCESFSRLRNTATTVYFELTLPDGTEEATGVTQDANADCQYVKDGGSPTNTVNNFADEGLGLYSMAITTGMIDGETTLIRCKNDTDYLSKCLRIETYGDGSSQHQPATVPADVVSIDGTSVSGPDDLKATGFSTFNAGSDTVTVGTNNDKTGYALTTTPPTASTIASQVRTELSTELARVDVDVSSRLAGASYTAPDNAGIAAAEAAAETVEARLTSARAGYLDKLNVSGTLAHTDNASTFQADTTGLVEKTDLPDNFELTLINGSGHISRVSLVDTTTANTDMRGTDSALLASNYTAPDNAGIAAAEAAAEAVETRLTSARAGYLDKLNVSGALAHSDDAGTYQADVSNLMLAASYTAPDNAGIAAAEAAAETVEARLTSARAGYLDKLNVSGALAHSDAAATYRADVSGLATTSLLMTVSSDTAAIISSLGDISAVTDKLDDTLELDTGLFRFTATSLAEAPTGSGGGGDCDEEAIADAVAERIPTVTGIGN